jgi:hypothetical protein
MNHGSGVWGNADNSAGNSITFVDGLAESEIESDYCAYQQTVGGGYNYMGIGWDGAAPDKYATNSITYAGEPSYRPFSMAISERFPAAIGMHFVQAKDRSDGGGNAYGSGVWEELSAALEM